MTGKKIGYVRVSTVEQNPDRQLEGVELHKKFIDYASGTSTDRPQLKAMIEYVRDDDHIYVHALDRLCRNLKDLMQLVEMFIAKGVTVHFIKENMEFSADKKNPMSNLLLALIGAIAEFEHSLIKERQREGMLLAKKAGKCVGRTKTLKPFMIDQLKHDASKRDKPLTVLSKEFGISRATLYRYLKEAKNGS